MKLRGISMPSWQKLLQNAITCPTELLELLHLPASLTEGAAPALAQFKLRVPRGFVAKMRKEDPHDPLLLQVLPLAKELNNPPGFITDPLQESKANPIPGLLHKYQSRVLLTVTSACAINCRYCFRRHFPYQDNNPGIKGWQQACEYIEKDPNINEVILSGGDPLLVNDDYLASLVARIEIIPHIKTLRIHSRMPIVLPERITNDLVSCLQQTRLNTVMVTHSNHPQECDVTLEAALMKLRQANVTLLNQSVLLKGINDSASVLAELSHTLFDMGVMPYYLHLLDKVAGSAHFDVPETTAQSILQTLQQQLPGYLVPKLVKEVAGEKSKVLVESEGQSRELTDRLT